MNLCELNNSRRIARSLAYNLLASVEMWESFEFAEIELGKISDLIETQRHYCAVQASRKAAGE